MDMRDNRDTITVIKSVVCLLFLKGITTNFLKKTTSRIYMHIIYSNVYFDAFDRLYFSFQLLITGFSF